MRPPNTGVGGASTINDVARLAGVSIKTVSRVMNDEPNVRQETRDKVQEAATLLHYRPNLLARSLAGSRSFLVALFYDNPNPAYITELQKGVINRARGSGYHLLVEPQDSHAPDLARQITNLLATIRLDGIILSPPLCDMAVVLQAIEAAGVPYVRVSPFLNPDRSPCVRMDDAQAAYELTRKLIEMGHTDIGFVLGHPEHGGAHQRYEGFVRALREDGMEPRPEWTRQGYFSYESGVEAARAILAPGTKHPTAIFASNDYMALGVMAHAQQAGLRLPDDLSVAGFDDAPGALRTWPPLTTVRQPVEDMAYAAADLLLNRNDAGADQDRMLPFALIMRESVRAR
ncbi:LacI family DNA-binding transcriptional regulator [Asticcacaulis sp. YBE204]|uniref:LacI family DNA-binding transcriptional regulator n=1 Tax=Asticcacaulis sp. YBE204 TaxID=1282363 RepID=UPI0003C3D6B1|nr:LacI family DNA-binding transcriptional regulator [Asticcacaulis sp. YBE204]ESQ79578.1 hypothetical protein AEYBE204_06975 [Asticcacaulis sp. YBE204]